MRPSASLVSSAMKRGGGGEQLKKLRRVGSCRSVCFLPHSPRNDLCTRQDRCGERRRSLWHLFRGALLWHQLLGHGEFSHRGRERGRALSDGGDGGLERGTLYGGAES